MYVNGNFSEFSDKFDRFVRERERVTYNCPCICDDTTKAIFSIISDELEQKVQTLGFTKNNEITPEQLELIDLHYEDMKNLYEELLEKIKNETKEHERPEEEIMYIMKERFLTRLENPRELARLFREFPGISRKISEASYHQYAVLIDIARDCKDGENIPFSLDLILHFGRIDIGAVDMSSIIEASDILRQHMGNNPKIANDVLRLIISYIESSEGYPLRDRRRDIRSIVTWLSLFTTDKSDGFIEHYPSIMRIALASGMQAPIVRDYYPSSFSFRGSVDTHVMAYEEIFGVIQNQHVRRMFEETNEVSSFASEFQSRYPTRWTEISQKLREVYNMPAFKYNNQTIVGLIFIRICARYLDAGADTCFRVLDELQQNIRENHALAREYGQMNGGINFFVYCMVYLPNEGRKILGDILSINDGNGIATFDTAVCMCFFILYTHPDVVTKHPEILQSYHNFFKNILRSKKNVGLIDMMNGAYSSDSRYITLQHVIPYLIHYKKKNIIPFILLLQHLQIFDISLMKIDELFSSACKDLQFCDSETLSVMFSGNIPEDTDFYKNFIKNGGEQDKKRADEVRMQIQYIMPKNGKMLDPQKILPVLRKLQNVMAELIFAKFEKDARQAIKSRIQKDMMTEIGEGNDAFMTDEFLELYKIWKNYNQSHAKELIIAYLHSQTYTNKGNPQDFYPYNISENKGFFQKNMTSQARAAWLDRHERSYDVGEGSDTEARAVIDASIKHHMDVSQEKLQRLKIGEIPDSPGKLIHYFDTILKKEREKFDKNIFDDLELQIQAIKKLLKSTKSRTIKKITIYHELDPMRIVMMGNWVDESCLNTYYNDTNCWSVITNALEVNKGVFYIEDEGGNVIGRVLVGIDHRNPKLEIHPIYTRGNLQCNLRPYVQRYMIELCQNMGLNGIDGSRQNVLLLFCDDWYSGD